MNREQFKQLAEDITQYAVEKGADDAVTNAYMSRTRQIRFSENRTDIFNRWNVAHFQLFLSRKKSVVATTVRGAESYREVVDAAIRTAEVSPPSEDYAGIAGRTGAKSHAREEKMLSDSRLSSFVEEAVSSADENGAVSATGTLYNEVGDHYIASSSGIRLFENGSSLYLSVRCMVDDNASGHSVVSSLSERGFRPGRAAAKAARLARLVGKPVHGTEGKFDAILDPMVMATLVSHVGSMSSAFNVAGGLSCFGGRIGRRVASEVVTIDDDATRGLAGRRYFDDEGSMVRKTRIISKGTLKSYLHNTSTAKKFGTRTTGNAGLISPAAHSLSMQEGRDSFREMMSELRDGLYINNVWYTRYQNRRVGNFSTIPRDAILRIKKGEIVGSVRDIRVTENLKGLFQRIAAVSKEREHINWWLESFTPSTVPYALVRKLNITRSADAA